ncbi:MAG TPA: hypothetical protein VE396_10310, partial [Xanthobacteraceae bacterium]|nr:hypothetical protein [Xanthobacteraceae bacterium]
RERSMIRGTVSVVAMGIEPRPKMGATLDRYSRAYCRENDLAGLGKPLESYCNSMEGFPRVGSPNELKLQACSTPSTGTIGKIPH